ncbi:hypothetical protein N7481_002139 [Penicillium waksmanii]|uniref:uncharacterized protein n=1 Tax=Penicillium waksmanii TaxID=69791 RepID=UPI002548883A|nr:uncharacterized protein N7481_002139 [Penicillium waksmanii]KAJ5995162.1 hypothetical protein N7481_002139 [Penicillium waksmanii]
MSTIVQMTVLVLCASGTTTISTTTTTTTKPLGDFIAPGGYVGIGIAAGHALGALALFIKTKMKERKEKKDRETAEEGIPKMKGKLDM